MADMVRSRGRVHAQRDTWWRDARCAWPPAPWQPIYAILNAFTTLNSLARNSPARRVPHWSRRPWPS